MATKLEIKLFEERMPTLADSKLQSDLLKASGVVGIFSDILLESHAPCSKPNVPAKLFWPFFPNNAGLPLVVFRAPA